MIMSEHEIKESFLQAKAPLNQIAILADLNQCKKSDIRRVLVRQGIPEKDTHAANVMTGKEVYDSLNNAWLALCQLMREHPEADTQRAMNLLRRMMLEVHQRITDTEKAEQSAKAEQAAKAEQQITMEDWMKWLGM